MPKAIKGVVRTLIFTMIGKYQDIKLDNERIQNEKIHRLDEILTAAESDMVRVKTLVKELKCFEEKESLNSETKYLDTISTMTEISVRTIKTIKKEGSINQGEWNTLGKKRPRQGTVSNLDDFDITAIRNKINEF
ncbi:hypothetical protein ACJJTC_008812 [Scirpophaga incertulas]